MKTAAIIGASDDRRKYGKKAARAFVRQGDKVFAVNPKEKIIWG
ncbi:MAG: CoA-binding protein [Verrucomicrobia bacterium]|jgi:hypothetical protein|nr:CoA-binding protein [Verrucomicrobiota bacterium]